MKIRIFLISTLLWLASGMNAQADDTDLFLTPPATAQRPNVLIIIDNTANWSSAFDAEISALSSVIGGLTDQVNVGLMMFSETGAGNGSPDGAYVRSAIKQMTLANKSALLDLIQGLNKNSDKSNGAAFGLASVESYLYLTGKAAYAGHNKVKRDTTAFLGDGLTYRSPMTDPCQSNFIIFISNGPGSDSTSDSTVVKNKLATYAGTTPTEVTLNPNGEQSNWSDEWARWEAGNDISTLDGTQNILTYTVDIYSSTTGQSASHTALLKSMSGGSDRYYHVPAADATSASVIAAKLNDVFRKIQAVDSVFAASTLPVSVNVRGTYLNQVYMGVFRPDQNASPRWPGNLKQYKLAVNSDGGLFLADANGVPIENSSTGYVSPTVTSYWTSDSTNYWTFRYPTAGSDLPDGDKVEKGGAAQRLRSAYAASQATRKVFTCTGTCANGTSFSTDTNDTIFGTANTNITQALLGAATATERDNIINWIRGADNMNDEDGDGVTTEMRPSAHGDVLHSRPAVINYNRSGTTEGTDVFVFYGGNDGAIRGIKGGQAATDGAEQWSFVPSEFFSKLKRLRDAETDTTAAISTLKPKGYMADGPIGVYQFDNNSDGRFDTSIDSADKVQLFMGMRRGGRFIYALDVSTPTAPKFLWKKTNTSAGYTELGYTFSEPKVAKINWGGTAKYVLVFGGGYDPGASYGSGSAEPNVDDLDPDRTYTDITSSVVGSISTTTTTTTRRRLTADSSASGTLTWDKTVTVKTDTINTAPTPATATSVTAAPVTTSNTATRSMGRIIYVVDIADGSVLWSGGRSGSGATLAVANMDYSIPSDVTVLDLNGDGYADTFYVGDTGGNLWRGNIGSTSSASWTIDRLASLGGADVNKRKFLYKPDVVLADTYRAILIGSGDREHPLDTVATNRFYMVRDTGTTSGLTEANLYDATNNDVQSAVAATASSATAAITAANGWYITLSSGEKTVGGAVTVGGGTYFATNKPSASTPGQCSNLGLAYYYGVNYENGAALSDSNANGVTNKEDRITGTSVGLAPSPIGISVEIGGKTYETVCMGTHCVDKLPSAKVGQRYRVYWHLELDK